MKSLLIIIFLTILTIASDAQNDSLVKKTHFVMSVSVAPNMVFRDYYLGKDPGYNNYGGAHFQTPRIGISANVNFGIQHKNSTFTLGFGFENNSYKDATRTITYQHEHYFLIFPIEYLKLIGKEKKWMWGLISEISYLYRFGLKTTVPATALYSSTYTYYDYNKPQYAFWVGFEFGRKIEFVDRVQLNLTTSLKLSSYISGESDTYGIPPAIGKNLVVSSFNLTFCTKPK